MSEDQQADAHDEGAAVKLSPGVLAELVSLTPAQPNAPKAQARHINRNC